MVHHTYHTIDARPPCCVVTRANSPNNQVKQEFERMVQATAPAHSQEPVNTPKLGMWMFLASEVMFFSVLIAMFLLFRFRSGVVPSEILNIPLTAINTFILLTSSMTVVQGLAAIQRGDQGKFRLWMIISLILGTFFISVQIIEYRELIHEGLTISSDLFGTAFFTLTGFHGAHVFIGLVWLLALIIQGLRGRFTAQRNLPIEIFGLYWHFVDIVWILLFVIVYLI